MAEGEYSPPGPVAVSSHVAARNFWQSMALHPPMVGTAIVTDCACSPSISRLLDEYYDEEEILAALRDLSEEEIKQIQRLARIRMGNTARPGHVEVEDLFIEAAIRTMERKRRWKRGVSISIHFLAVMRSICHQRFKQAGRYTSLSDVIAEPHNWSLSILDAQTIVARLKEKLRDDAIALKVLESMRDETRPRNAQRCLGISDRVYWAARKRIRRHATQ
jgi:hypothetical protein